MGDRLPRTTDSWTSIRPHDRHFFIYTYVTIVWLAGVINPGNGRSSIWQELRAPHVPFDNGPTRS